MLTHPMKNIKTDFFASPHPHHPQFARSSRLPWHPSWDCDLAEDNLFPRIASPCPPSPAHHPTPLSPKPLSNLSSFSEEEEQKEDYYCINQKLEFSEEHLSPLTPRRVTQQAIDPTTTAKKVMQPHLEAQLGQTPTSNKPTFERGLKSLAYEAFRFVAQQRKSSYKEVAMNLVLQRQDYDTVHKKGEMNIKRRVYDALNVLIAVGLLKRKGNRISANRKLGHPQAQIEEESGKREVLEQERSSLRSECWSYGQRVMQKREQLERMKKQTQAYRELVARNSIKQGNYKKISMPCIALCCETDQLCSHSLTINRTEAKVQVRYKGQGLTLLSELDLLTHTCQHESDRRKCRNK